MSEDDGRSKDVEIETLSIHSGEEIDPGTGAVRTPIHVSTTFEREPDGSYPKGYMYTRVDNPNRKNLEDCIRELEGGEAAAAFSSGSAASSAVLSALSPGGHVLAPEDVYYGTRDLMEDIHGRWGLETSFVDMTDENEVEGSIKDNTELIWVETPSNPLLEITDIGRISEIAHDKGALCVCDNTWSTPVIQKPLALEADLVVYSTTKYFGGHGDALGGAVVSKSEDSFFELIRDIQTGQGSVPSPFNCWLIQRGMMTLPYRMRAHSDNAMKIAAYLEGHPVVKEVYYPGLERHRGHELAKRQMDHFGGMLSFRVEGGKERAFDIASNVNIITRATSLGDVKTLIEHRASIEGEGTSTPQDLLRLSVGIENADDLIDDLEAALGSRP